MDRYYQADVTTAVGTSATNPLTTVVPLENCTLVDVEVFVPPGHAGLTGVRIRQSAQQIIPWANNSWITADNYARIFDVNTEIGSRAISVQTYNTDVFPHLHTIRFHIRDLNSGATASPLSSGGPLVNVISQGFDSNTVIGPGGIVLPAPTDPSSVPVPVPTIPLPPVFP